MKRLKHTGNGYHGTLPEGGTILACRGEIVEVSEEKAAQLFSDFPGEWEETDEAVGKTDLPPALKAPEIVKPAEEINEEADDDGQELSEAMRRGRGRKRK
ncbi:MAG: hypothetical protein E6Q97_39090 [Desulfurellales bacterium]|nr:MAG: hypothetical protein E6Q97_39090 [Desulfurellales bacterium]